MSPSERVGRDTVAAMQNLSGSPSLGVVSALYAAVFELARRTGQTPRTVLEVVFGDAPSDEEWRDEVLPFLGEDAAA
ncbi:MAG: hypothetical protein M3168_01485 [Actinomycetota bacterium]|nr:hypothetical protein [Actinomycetota bacterium]